MHLSRIRVAVNTIPTTWGVHPVLGHWLGHDISSYAVFMGLGVATGIGVYLYEARQHHRLGERGILIAIGSLIGGTIGAKLLEWSIHLRFVFDHLHDWPALLSGRTIVGGFIGGTIGVMVTKRLLKITDKRGNFFAPGIALGVAIGRIGCFLRGCCYGKPTTLPWGVDFGDHIARHPTQLYESLFMLIMFGMIQHWKKRPNLRPGQLFNWLMIAYFIYRFFVEFIKVEPVSYGGLTVFQYISVLVLLYLTRTTWMKWLKPKPAAQ